METPGPLLRDRVAIITGAASGIGLAAAGLFAAHGARLVLVDWDQKGLDEAGERLAQQAEGLEMLAADVGGTGTAEQAAQLAVDSFGQLDVVVSNAGVHGRGATPEERWGQSLDINLKPSYMFALAALPHLRQSDHPAIIFVSSISGPVVGFASPHYDAAKAGLVGLARHLASAWGRYGIRVNAICPGFVMTPFIGEYWDEQRLGAVRQDVALGRMGEAEEIARVILFLGSEMSSYVTGTAIVADGGWTIHYSKY